MNLPLPDLRELWPSLVAAAPMTAMVLIVALGLNYALGRALRFVVRRTHYTENEIRPVRRAVRWAIFLAAVVLILGALGINVGGVWGVLSTVLAMVAIGFVAVWSVLSNALCTLLIMVFRPFVIGDEVEFPGEPVRGRVLDFNFMHTTLDDGDGAVLKVPNNLFFQKTVRRWRRARVGHGPAPLRHPAVQPAAFVDSEREAARRP